MGKTMQIWNTYISPATDLLLDIGSSLLRWKDLYISTLVSDTAGGVKIGTATSQKLGFFNATPIVQVGATTDLGVTLSNLGFRAAGTAYPITTSGDVNLSGTVRIPTVNFGDPTTEGTWRMTIDTGNLVIQYRTGGNWVEKGKFEP